MYVIAVFLFFLLHEVATVPLYRRMPSAKFTNISREAFKKLSFETWQGGSTLDDAEGKKLLQSTNYRNNPKIPHFNSTQLKELLGENFDPTVMSETKPNQAWLKTKNQLDRRTTFEAYKHEGDDVDSITKLLDKKRIDLNGIEFEDLRVWLWNLTQCTVEPLWKDFGRHVWPRYVNFGKCSNKPTCSFPGGMRCRPSEEKSVRLLYWICPKNITRCFWSSFGTKVIRACSCSC